MYYIYVISNVYFCNGRTWEKTKKSGVPKGRVAPKHPDDDPKHHGDYFFFPPLLQQLFRDVFRMRYQLYEATKVRDLDNSCMRYVSNARKVWLQKGQYNQMLKRIGREEACKYDKVHWIIVQEDTGKKLASLEQQREWGKEVNLFMREVKVCVINGTVF